MPLTDELSALVRAEADRDDAAMFRWLLQVGGPQLLSIAWGLSNCACLVGPDQPDRVRATIREAMREYDPEDSKRTVLRHRGPG